MAASVGYVLAQLQRWTSPRLEELPDAVLLKRFRQERDEAAFAALVARHGAMVLRSCRRILGDVHESEDALQATFLILARKAHTLRQPGALPGYLHSIARRVALKARRAGLRKRPETRGERRESRGERRESRGERRESRGAYATPLAEELPDTRGDPLSQLTARELLTVLDEEIARLPAKQRSAVLLCCLEGHTREEAAKTLGCTPGSLKGHLERGRQRLQARLQRRGIALSAALALVVLARDRVAGHVPALLLQSTIRAALNGSVGSTASLLANSVLGAMLLPKLAGVMAVTLTFALAASATMVLLSRGSRTEIPEEKTPVVPVAAKAADDGKPQVRTDALGDPLPEGALLRLGTIRYRAAGTVFHAALSPDGKQLATASNPGIALFDLATGKSRPLRNSSVAPFSDSAGSLLAFSPDGRQLVNVTAGGNLHFWDVATGKLLRVVGDRREPVPGERGFPIRGVPPGVLHFSKVWFPPQGKEVVVGTPSVAGKRDNVVLFLEPSTGKILRRIRVASQFASIADNGKTLVAIDDKRPEAVLYDDAGKELRRFHHGDEIDTATLCQGGKRLVTVNDKAEIKIWDAATGKVQRTIAGPAKKTDARTPWVVSIAPEGHTLFAGTHGGDILRWNLGSGKESEPLRGHGHIVSGLFYAPDGRSLISVSWDNVIRRWKLPSGQAEPVGEGYAFYLRVARSPDGRAIAVASYPGRLEFWDPAAGKRLRAFSLPTEFVSQMRFAPDGKLLAIACSDPSVRLWDVDKGRIVREWKLPASKQSGGEGRSWFDGLAWSPDGRLLAAALQLEGMWMWETATGKEIWHAARRGVLAFAPDGKTLVSGGWDQCLTFQDPATGKVRFILNNKIKIIHDIAFSTDGSVLATCHEDGAICLRDPETGRPRKDLRTHHYIPFSVSFSADSTWLASSGIDGAVCVWETATAAEVLSRRGHAGWVRHVEFSPDGRTALSASDDLTALLWDLHPGSERGRRRPLETLWADLAGEPAKAYRAVWELASDPIAASELLRQKIAPIKPALEERRLQVFIADLDSDDFAVRQKATAELEKIGQQGMLAFRKALEGKPSLESRRRLEDLLAKAQRSWEDLSNERLRSLRAIQVLELAGTKEAREVLQALAAGAEPARLTHEAKAALQRLTDLSRTRRAAE